MHKGLNRTILAIAVPTFAAVVSEPLMLAADTAIVGRLGRAELAALGASSTVLTSLIGFCIFLAYGSTALVSRRQGAGDTGGAMTSAVGALWLAAGLGSALSFVVYLSARPVAGLFSSSLHVRDLTQSYLQIASASIPAALIIMAATGALRGVLDLRTPLLVMITANIVNVIVTLVLVYSLGFGLAGAAAGLVLAQWFAAAWLLLVLRARVRAVGVPTHPDFHGIVDVARHGVALFVRTATLRSVLLIATWLASNIGDIALAAHQIAMALLLMSAFALDAIAIAGQTLTGHALGSGDIKRTREITSRVITWGWASGLAFGSLLGLSSTVLPRVFSSDYAVQAASTSALIVIAIIMPISGIVYVLDGVLIGAGDGRYLAWAGVFALLCYVPLAVTITVFGTGFATVWIAYAAFMLIRFGTVWCRQKSDRWLILGPTATR